MRQERLGHRHRLAVLVEYRPRLAAAGHHHLLHPHLVLLTTASRTVRPATDSFEQTYGNERSDTPTTARSSSAWTRSRERVHHNRSKAGKRRRGHRQGAKEKRLYEEFFIKPRTWSL